MIVADDGVDPDGLMACQSLQHRRSLPWIRYFQSIDSTNSAALRDLQDVAPSTLPRLYLADQQSAGRGRHGRTWVADHGTLTFSLAVSRENRSITSSSSSSTRTIPISLAIGVAVARTIDHLAAPFSTRIKWPNDVYCNDGKVAGILIESSPMPNDSLVIGVGVNVSTDLKQPSPSFDSPARSISEFTQRYPHRYQWLVEVVEQILDAVDELHTNPRSILQEYRKRCMLYGQSIRYLAGDQWHHAACEGIDDDGALLIRDVSGVRRLSSGDVQRVRRTEPAQLG
jgi:BirA family transcriptional regulator, biotin operon repressor / biotin---[acetyl-CoA-carboxylase] ligase